MNAPRILGCGAAICHGTPAGSEVTSNQRPRSQVFCLVGHSHQRAPRSARQPVDRAGERSAEPLPASGPCRAWPSQHAARGLAGQAALARRVGSLPRHSLAVRRPTSPDPPPRTTAPEGGSYARAGRASALAGPWPVRSAPSASRTARANATTPGARRPAHSTHGRSAIAAATADCGARSARLPITDRGKPAGSAKALSDSALTPHSPPAPPCRCHTSATKPAAPLTDPGLAGEPAHDAVGAHITRRPPSSISGVLAANCPTR